MTGWQFTRPAILAREVTARIVGPLLSWLVCGPVVVGRHHVDSVEVPFLVCPNHVSHFDFSTIRLGLGPRHRRRLVATAAADYWRASRVRSFLSAWLGAMPFHRRHTGAASIRAVESFLAAGWNVLLFPEGTRSRSGEMATFKPGIGLLATRTGRPVIPVRIVGLHEVLPPGAVRPRRGCVEVRFGEPLRSAPGEDPRAFAARLEAAVRGL